MRLLTYWIFVRFRQCNPSRSERDSSSLECRAPARMLGMRYPPLCSARWYSVHGTEVGHRTQEDIGHS